MDFYSVAFGAQELFHWPRPMGKSRTQRCRSADSILMLADENPAIGATLARVLRRHACQRGFSTLLDVDGVWRKALGAGATARTLPADMFWGDSARDAEGPIRARVVDRHAYRGRVARRDAEAWRVASQS